MTIPSHKSTRRTPQTPDRIGAVSAFLLDRESLLPIVAARLGADATFESAIRGSSMAPAIPKFSRLRVELLGKRAPKPGDILYYLGNDGFVVHRLVRHISASSGRRYLLTIGDNCLSPDPPVCEHRILGIVTAVETSSGMRPPDLPRPNSVLHQLARAISIQATLLASRISVSAAAHASVLFHWLESIGRLRVGRVLRFVGLLRNH